METCLCKQLGERHPECPARNRYERRQCHAEPAMFVAYRDGQHRATPQVSTARRPTQQKSPKRRKRRKAAPCGGCTGRKKAMNRVIPKSGDIVETITRATGIKSWWEKKQLRKKLASTEIIVASFRRHGKLLDFIESVRAEYPEIGIRVVDDSFRVGEEKTDVAKAVIARDDIYWHSMEFDSGVTAKRNRGVRDSWADTVIICDDDFLFTDDTDLPAMLEVLDTGNVDICGGLVRMDGVHAKNWCGMLSMHGSTLRMRHVDTPRQETPGGVPYWLTHVTMNFFAAPRQILLDHPWDERFKITAEHLDSMIGFWKAGVRIAYTTSSIVGHQPGGSSDYQKYRKRNNPAIDLLKRKWGIRRRRMLGQKVFHGL